MALYSVLQSGAWYSPSQLDSFPQSEEPIPHLQEFARTPAAPMPVRRRHVTERALVVCTDVLRATSTYSWVARSGNALIGAGKHKVLFAVGSATVSTYDKTKKEPREALSITLDKFEVAVNRGAPRQPVGRFPESRRTDSGMDRPRLALMTHNDRQEFERTRT